MVSSSPDGDHGAIMDITAVLRMIPLDIAVDEAVSLETQPGSVDRTPGSTTQAATILTTNATHHQPVVGGSREPR